MDGRHNALAILDKRPDGGGATTRDNVGSRNQVEAQWVSESSKRHCRSESLTVGMIIRETGRQSQTKPERGHREDRKR